MTHVLSTINLKGGVGKTTTTIALADMLCVGFQKKVLIIDLDPQTNATVMLIGEERWAELNEKGHTIAQIFKNALNISKEPFDLEKTLQKNVCSISQRDYFDSLYNIDLLPSSLDLIRIQDKLINIPKGDFEAIRPFDVLQLAVGDLIEDYDIVIIDCPPNLGTITRSGLRMSQNFIIPAIPDILSTYGIPQIVKEVSDFSRLIMHPIKPLGIVITKYRSATILHNNTIKQLEQNHETDSDWPPVFNAMLPERTKMAQAAEYKTYRTTIREKWGGSYDYENLRALTQEILEAVSK